MNYSPFSCPIFLGHPRARGRCSQGERVLYGRDLRRSGGTGKAEAAKMPGAGIGPKQCPGKCVAEKGRLAEMSAQIRSLKSGDSQSQINDKSGLAVVTRRLGQSKSEYRPQKIV